MKTPLVQRALTFSTRRPWLVIGLTLALTAVFGFFAAKVGVDADYGNILPKDAEVNRLIKAYAGEKADTQLLVLAIEGPALYAPCRAAGVRRRDRQPRPASRASPP